jgi:membrane protein DedA with SNARE-associated domain
MEATLGFILTYRYLALFPLALLEGPIVSFVAGVLVTLGYLSPLPAFTLLILGDVIPDMAYYLFGHYGGKSALMQKYLERNKSAAAHLDTYKKLWHEDPWKMMFMSKLAYGLSTLLLVSAGIVKLPVGKFFRYALFVTLLQYGVLMFAGYHFGALLFGADRYLSYIGYAAAILAVVFITGVIGMKRFAKRELERLSDTPIS